jgi:hypothetical protein
MVLNVLFQGFNTDKLTSVVNTINGKDGTG